MYNHYPWKKKHYKCIPIGVANSLDIFQQNMNILFHRFEWIHAYIENLLVSTKGYWIDHVLRLEITQNKLEEKELKYDIENYLFGQTLMEYLGFWVTRDGTKTINKNT